jgi:acyl carrier protein
MTTTDTAADTTPLRTRVLAVVRAAICESLAIPETDIKLDARLIDDLGADSLDFVDIVFTLDRELEIKVKDSEFNFLTRLDFSSPEVMKAGHLTVPVVERLSLWLPELAKVEDKAAVTPRRLFSFITVESVCIVAETRMRELGKA